MLKGPLPGKHHSNLRVSLVAGLDRLVIIHGTACLQDCGNALLDANIGPVTEGEEGIGYHNRAGKAGLVLHRCRAYPV